MLVQPFEIENYYQNETKFNSVYCRNNLSKKEEVVYVINLNENKSIRTDWIAFYLNDNNKRAS